MKVRDLVTHLQSLPQDAEVLVADYYYGDREGFVAAEPIELADMIKSATDTLHSHYGDVFLLDSRGV